MNRKQPTTTVLPILAALALTTAGCIPLNIKLNLDSSSEPVQQAVVLGAPSLRDSVAQIDLTGTIGSAGLLFGSGISIEDLDLMLRFAAEDDSIKAVLLRIDSPGGGVGASETLYNLLRDFKADTGKPVVVTMGTVAASGGYYIAMAADTIVAQPSTVTGSVGVIIPSINAADGLNRIGIRSNSVTSGPNKDLGSPVAPANPEHQAILQSLVDDFYDQFRTLVLENRTGITDPNTTLDGRVFTGRQALAAGLVDQLGGIPEAFSTAKQLAGLDQAKLVKLHRRSSEPTSPYASVTAQPRPEASAQSNWPIPAIIPPISRDPGAGVYYLWLPPGTLASP